MTRNQVLASVVLCLFLLPFSFSLAAEGLPVFTIMTEDWKPYQFEENGELKGVAVEILALILKEIQSNQTVADIKILPWARGYLIAKSEKNAILFSMTRTPERDSQFKWVGPIFQNTTYCLPPAAP